MGLIKAAATSLKTTFADQWIDYFYCESIPEDVLTVKSYVLIKKLFLPICRPMLHLL